MALAPTGDAATEAGLAFRVRETVATASPHRCDLRARGPAFGRVTRNGPPGGTGCRGAVYRLSLRADRCYPTAAAANRRWWDHAVPDIPSLPLRCGPLQPKASRPPTSVADPASTPLPGTSTRVMPRLLPGTRAGGPHVELFGTDGCQVPCEKTASGGEAGNVEVTAIVGLHAHYRARRPLRKTDTPPGPTRRPARIKAIPRIHCPWTSSMMPTTTRITASTQSRVGLMVTPYPSGRLPIRNRGCNAARRRPPGIECAMRHRALRGLRLGRDQPSDAEPPIRMSIAGPRRPPGLPELNALAPVIAMSVDSRPSRAAPVWERWVM
jgi:hypothetical protein